MVFEIIYGIEDASNPTINPTTPQIRESLATSSLLGSPLAVKKRKPEIRNIITANPTNNSQRKPSILFTTAQMSSISPGCPGGGIAKVIKGNPTSTTEE